MLFRLADLEAIRAGRVDLAFRRWKRPRVRPGSRLRTAVGLVEVIDVRVVSMASIDAGELERAGLRSRAELKRLLARREGDVHRVELRFAGADPRVALRERDRWTMPSGASSRRDSSASTARRGAARGRAPCSS